MAGHLLSPVAFFALSSYKTTDNGPTSRQWLGGTSGSGRPFLCACCCYLQDQALGLLAVQSGLLVTTEGQFSWMVSQTRPCPAGVYSGSPIRPGGGPCRSSRMYTQLKARSLAEHQLSDYHRRNQSSDKSRLWRIEAGKAVETGKQAGYRSMSSETDKKAVADSGMCYCHWAYGDSAKLCRKGLLLGGKLSGPGTIKCRLLWYPSVSKRRHFEQAFLCDTGASYSISPRHTTTSPTGHL
jgi:hypothetical protein